MELSSESITVDQLHTFLGDLKAKDAKVTIHVSAFHYEQYTEITIENKEIPLEEKPNGGGQATAAPAPPRFRQKDQIEVKQKKVETFQTEHHIPLTYCSDLTGPTLEGWQPKKFKPVVINLKVFPMDRKSSERLEQYKSHLASQYANKDKILETKVKFSVKEKTLEAGMDPITITAYDPKFVDVANSGFCCFGRPGVKRATVTVIKKFSMAPLHISGEGNGLVPPSVNGHPSSCQPSVGGFPQQQPSAPAPQYPPTPQYSQAPQYTQASQYPPTSQYPPLAPAVANQNWSQPPYLLS